MSVLESRINTIASIALDASVNKVDATNSVLFGDITLNPISTQPNNNFTVNVPTTFNTRVSIVGSLDVLGLTRLNNKTSVLSDLYISGNTYFGTSSIGSYLKLMISTVLLILI